jgi:hypothetical protein
MHAWLANNKLVRVQGYDVVALSSPGRFVVGLDICDTAIQKAKQLVICLFIFNYLFSSSNCTYRVTKCMN